MPHPNRYQSSPELRLLSSQRSDTSLPTRYTSMSTPDSFSYNASIRRLGSRRARPSAASIADMFVGSLVLAGYCRDHGPRTRGLSTMPANATGNNNMGRWRDRGFTHSRQLSSKHRLGYLGSPTGLQRTNAQRMINSGVAMRVEEEGIEENCPPKKPAEVPFSEKHREDTGLQSALTEMSNQVTPTPKPEPTSGTQSTASRSTPEEDRNRPSLALPNKSQRDRYYGRRSPAQELRISTERVFHIALKDSASWKKAVDLVANDARVSPSGQNRPEKMDKSVDALEYDSVKVFLEALWDEAISNHYVFRLYRDLPAPGVSYLSKRSRGALLRRFACPSDRRPIDARRYLALVDDMVDAKLPLSRSLWSSAISFAGRSSGKVRKSSLVQAIGIWQQMEHLGGVKADEVVFATLFDIAIKANQFTVAERLLEEMKNRGIKFGRFGKVSTMYYYGMLGDPVGIQQKFDEFVSSGEIVDTVVMNCLMAAFIRTGEIETAQQLYAQMMEAGAVSRQAIEPGLDPRRRGRFNLVSEMPLYRSNARELGRVLRGSVALKDTLPEHHHALQESFRAVPDTRTFHIFLSLHVYTTADIDGFMSILTDMEKTYDVPPRGMIYLLFFSGFARNARRKKGWSAERLQVAWKSYLRALHESSTRLTELYRSQQGTSESANALIDESAAWPSVPRRPSGLYTPLPTSGPAAKVGSGEAQLPESGTRPHADGKRDVNDVIQNIAGTDEEIDVDELFNQHAQRPHLGLQEQEEIETRIENGVFLGRRMIVIILRAFGACCGPEEIMKVWLQMERIWHPEKRKALDVMIAREELERQMNRAEWRVTHDQWRS
ncbi:hypothetical protein BO71DRAFT_449612 [Aspergillus ellipticus CBS 707.79]|uniref:Pentatricopeptide repeat protein n=1 Tax=Aspergillus ellipticus CBS 707.79 TaxID=1448320 RepID=A0A319DCQ9_9EURO|nr:hypothetical protein BO71DRAFT_449612 [Aspergillus ellipticus CBS 707.79]